MTATYEDIYFQANGPPWDNCRYWQAKGGK
jgi:hypothetical protein